MQEVKKEERAITTSDAPVSEKLHPEVFLPKYELPIYNRVHRNYSDHCNNRTVSLKTGLKPEWDSIPEPDMEFMGGKYKLNLLGGIVATSEETLEDSKLADGAIRENSKREILLKVEEAIIKGDGVKQPEGFLQTCNEIDGDLTYPNILKVFNSINLIKDNKSIWMMSQSAYSVISGLGSNGRSLLLPDSESDGLLFNKQVFICAMPNENPVAFGDLSNYILFETDINTDILKEKYIQSGNIGYRTTGYFDGSLTRPDAVCALRLPE